MNRQILKLAIPNILSNLSIPLLSSVDIALMGRQDGAEYIGAIALGALIFNFVYWSFAFLRMGTTGFAAQAYGKSDNHQIINVLARALLLALVSGLIILMIQIPLGEMSFRLLGASETVETIAKEYYYIRVWAAPATLSLYVLMGWFFGMQNSVYPLILTFVVNAMNIICNVYFVNYLGMQADGVALGTVIAQYTGLVTGVLLFLYKYRDYIPFLQKEMILEWAAFKAFMSLNGNIFIRTFCLVFAFAFFDNQSAILGDLTLAANGVLLQFVFWMSYGVDGFGYAAESLIGRYYGSKNKALLEKAIKYSFYWGMGLAILYSLVYWIFGESMLYIFTDQEEIIEAARPFLIWIILFPILSTPGYIWDGIYIGFTASVAMRNTMVASFLTFLAFYYFQAYNGNWGNDGLWIALLIMMLSRGIYQWLWYEKKMKKVIFSGY